MYVNQKKFCGRIGIQKMGKLDGDLDELKRAQTIKILLRPEKKQWLN